MFPTQYIADLNCVYLQKHSSVRKYTFISSYVPAAPSWQEEFFFAFLFLFRYATPGCWFTFFRFGPFLHTRATRHGSRDSRSTFSPVCFIFVLSCFAAPMPQPSSSVSSVSMPVSHWHAADHIALVTWHDWLRKDLLCGHKTRNETWVTHSRKNAFATRRNPKVLNIVENFVPVSSTKSWEFFFVFSHLFERARWLPYDCMLLVFCDSMWGWFPWGGQNSVSFVGRCCVYC